jgi:hypothetical protein
MLAATEPQPGGQSMRIEHHLIEVDTGAGMPLPT